MKTGDSEKSRRRRNAAGETTSPSAATGGPMADTVAPATVSHARRMIKGGGCLALQSSRDGGGTVPVLAASNVIGGALISSGVTSIAGPALASRVPMLPVMAIGFEVNEAVHRLEIGAWPPTLEAGLRSRTRAGEAVATLGMRWLLAPDEFEISPNRVPPPTSLATERSQRVAILDGRLTLRDRTQSAIRFFGAGRTFPGAEGGRRLPFAATGVILEGTGALAGASGTLLISGHVTPPDGLVVTFVARLDEGSGVAIDGPLGPSRQVPDPDPGTSVMAFFGEIDPETTPIVFDEVDGVSAPRVRERLSVAWLGTDVGDAWQVRSLVREGGSVGMMEGSLGFKPASERCGERTEGVRRRLTLTDVAGRTIATAAADMVEGTALRRVAGGSPQLRLTGYGPLTDGTGALSGVIGMLTSDTRFDPQTGRASTLYVMRVADPDARFRGIGAEAYQQPQPPLAKSAGPVKLAAEEREFVEAHAGAELTEEDKRIVSYAERSLADGMEVERWFEQKDASGDYAERFDVVREFTQGDRSFGFFDRAPVGGRTLPVMGIVQEMFYDRQKAATGQEILPQLREFVLQYFMRVSHFRRPEAAAVGVVPSSPYLRMMSWLPDDGEKRVGFGYQQLYYKLKESGTIGRFAESEQSAVTDLRELGVKYDWIVLRVDIFDFNLSFAPLGSGAPKVLYPLKEQTFLVLGPQFVRNRTNPQPGVLGEYGYAYAFLPYAPGGPGMLAYGPGHFAAAYQSLHFRVLESGDIRVRASFIVNRPDKVAKIDIDPIEWSFQLADLFTFNMAGRMMAPVREVMSRLPLRITGIDPVGTYIAFANFLTNGAAGEQLGWEMPVLEKRMLVQHFMQHYEMLINSLLVWRKIVDWTDTENLPEFCRQGIAC